MRKYSQQRTSIQFNRKIAHGIGQGELQHVSRQHKPRRPPTLTPERHSLVSCAHKRSEKPQTVFWEHSTCCMEVTIKIQ